VRASTRSMVRNRHGIYRDLTAHILFRRDGRNGELMVSRDFGKRKGVAIQDAFWKGMAECSSCLEK
jgi:hypothetical protein